MFAATGLEDNLQRIGLSHVPLNLLAFIVSYVEDVGDLARLCRTSRILHYMTQPQLYKTITLTSYDTIRYRYDTPEGFGSASPFSVGLNALVTRNISSLVQNLTLQGEWREHDLEECSKAGRVPDGSMMLNIAVRAAVDRCTNLTSFSWKLNVRLMPTVHSALVSLNNLQAFHLRFPSTRTPQPSTTLPPLPNLREFIMTDYDPLCHPDDLSTMFVSAKNLEALTMHFSPRMRNNAEPSVHLYNLFRRNVAANQPLRLKHMAIYNCFAMAVPELEPIFLSDRLEDVTMINSFGRGNDLDPPTATHFVDQSWLHEHPHDHDHASMKSIRSDKISHLTHHKDLSGFTNLEKIYMVNTDRRKACEGIISSPSQSITPSPGTMTPIGPPLEIIRTNSISSPSSMTPTEILRDKLIEAICKHHGATLKHLILPSKVPLNHYTLSQLIRSCPNLTQLSFATEEINPDILRHVLPFATKLRAIRLTAPDGPGKEMAEKRRKFLAFEAREDHEYYLSKELSGSYGSVMSMSTLRYIGVEHKIWEVGPVEQEVQLNEDDDGNVIEQTIFKRRVRQAFWEDVAGIEIWKLDTVDMV